MNGAYVEGLVLSAVPGLCRVAVRSHSPHDRVDVVTVATTHYQGTWALEPGTLLAFGGRIVSLGHGRLELILEATTAYVNGQDVTTYTKT